MRNYLVVLLALAMIAAPAVPAQQKVELKFNLEKGKVYTQYFFTQQKIEQSINGQKQKIDQSMGMGTTFEVIETDAEGNKKVKITYTKVFFQQDSVMGKVLYDSSKPPRTVPPQAMGFAALLGNGYSVLFSPRGEVLEVYGADEMVQKMSEKFTGVPEFQKAMLVENLKKQFGDKPLKEQLQNMTAVYPVGPVAIGQTWSKEFSTGAPFPLLMQNTWKLKSRSRGVATIEVDSKFNVDPEAPPADMGNVKVKYNLAGTQKGMIKIEERSGWTVQGSMTQKFSGSMELIGMGMNIPISIDTIVTITPIQEK